MKVIAYITKCVPVKVEVDDKWKPMEDYGNHVDGTTEEEDKYFDENIENFLTDIENKLYCNKIVRPATKYVGEINKEDIK